MICSLIDGKFPNYEAVIPKENPNVLEIDRLQLLNSTKRASIFSSKTTNQVKFEIKGNLLKISAEDLDFNNKAEETLECNYNGDDIAIGFNSRFIVEMLNNLSSEIVQIELSSPNRAGLISPLHGKDSYEEITMLVMPIMLNLCHYALRQNYARLCQLCSPSQTGSLSLRFERSIIPVRAAHRPVTCRTPSTTTDTRGVSQGAVSQLVGWATARPAETRST